MTQKSKVKISAGGKDYTLTSLSDSGYMVAVGEDGSCTRIYPDGSTEPCGPKDTNPT